MSIFKCSVSCGFFMYLGLLMTVAASEPVENQLKGEVARAQFTTAIVEREPVDNVVVLGADQDQVYFFSDLRNLMGQKVVHRWEYGGRIEAEVEFEVTSNRWRAYSRKMLDSTKYGVWTVVVVSEQGWPLKATLFEYTEGMTQLLVTP